MNPFAKIREAARLVDRIVEEEIDTPRREAAETETSREETDK